VFIINFFRKIFIGSNFDTSPIHSTFQKRIRNIKAIWNNENEEDFGLERGVRLFLAISQLLFLGTYIKEAFHRSGLVYQEFSIDVFVIVKTLLPLFALYFGYQNNSFVFFILVWFLSETLLYVPTLIFASDIFSKPRSYRRSVLLLFFNYFEIILTFAFIYSSGDHLNKAYTWYDYIYFSFVTASTTGFGDIYPITAIGKLLVSIQVVIFMLFLVIFFNFFSNRLENKGYFRDDDN
jgi:hypothetical protein